ncbi:Arginine biosynthesis bifunctional protein ArgJ mitochondrial [Bienertia sinuspersici]
MKIVLWFPYLGARFYFLPCLVCRAVSLLVMTEGCGMIWHNLVENFVFVAAILVEIWVFEIWLLEPDVVEIDGGGGLVSRQWWLSLKLVMVVVFEFADGGLFGIGWCCFGRLKMGGCSTGIGYPIQNGCKRLVRTSFVTE